MSESRHRVNGIAGVKLEFAELSRISARAELEFARVKLAGSQNCLLPIRAIELNSSLRNSADFRLELNSSSVELN